MWLRIKFCSIGGIIYHLILKPFRKPHKALYFIWVFYIYYTEGCNESTKGVIKCVIW